MYAVGPQPENMLLLVHEVYEGLISDFFKGVKYEYLLPCTDCLNEVSLMNSGFSHKLNQITSSITLDISIIRE